MQSSHDVMELRFLEFVALDFVASEIDGSVDVEFPNGQISVAENVDVVVLAEDGVFRAPFVHRRVLRHVPFHERLLFVVEARFRTAFVILGPVADVADVSFFVVQDFMPVRIAGPKRPHFRIFFVTRRNFFLGEAVVIDLAHPERVRLDETISPAFVAARLNDE